MLELEIPGRGSIRLSSLVLDLNGTIAIDGELIAGVPERVRQLQERGMRCYLATADTRGRAAVTAEALHLDLHRLQPGQEGAQKAALVERLGAERVVAIGAGANDAGMLAAAEIGIAVIQDEGAAIAALLAADVIVPGICAALDLLIEPRRLAATLRC
ncbi:MAG: HAD family hydrolase [Anaerolineae bacterium]|nr:HAD family hydrolase [Anaerolineae bacterium]